MDNTSLINLKVNLTLLHFLNSLCYIHCDSATLRVRHQTTRTKETTQRTDLTHARRHSDDNIYISPTSLNLFNVFVKTCVISTGCLSSFFLIGRTETKDANSLTSSVGKRDNATYHLVSLTRVNTKANININRSVKLSCSDILNQLRCLVQSINLPCFNLLSY